LPKELCFKKDCFLRKFTLAKAGLINRVDKKEGSLPLHGNGIAVACPCTIRYID